MYVCLYLLRSLNLQATTAGSIQKLIVFDKNKYTVSGGWVGGWMDLRDCLG